MKSLKTTFSLVITLVLILVLCFFIVIPLYRNAQVLGEAAGVASGKTVGLAIGSYDGVTKDYPEGFEEGKKAGLSARDTKAEMKRSFSEVNRLEVLISSIRLKNYHEVGDMYKALYLLKADAVFTVDLSKAQVDPSEDGMTLFISLPQPEVKVYIDESQTERAWEYDKRWFNGSAEDGFDEYVNSMKNIESETEASIMNDEEMMNSARLSAEKQVTQIASGVCINGETIKIVWQ